MAEPAPVGKPISSGASFDIEFENARDAARVKDLLDDGMRFQEAIDMLELRPNEHFTVVRTDTGPDGRSESTFTP
ncbi:hypothetical protein [Mycolicibacterium sphagni]|uniref:hypothetical protein n=1 Tax=Mycolicibacterium sphagni TaxID=1786 RepID=UPI0021F3BC44|nr:hypothetical protein [Mycolicibacterium sphagni]MCV7174953.1 hypothetical protein [Mycolicibacterium sphagni]